MRRGGDYLSSLEANRPATYDDVARFFDDPPPGMVEPTHETVDADQGRLERRRRSVCHADAWLWSDRRYPDEPRFPHLAMIGLVETRVERNGKTESERRYYLSSAKPSDLCIRGNGKAARTSSGMRPRGR